MRSYYSRLLRTAAATAAAAGTATAATSPNEEQKKKAAAEFEAAAKKAEADVVGRASAADLAANAQRAGQSELFKRKLPADEKESAEVLVDLVRKEHPGTAHTPATTGVSTTSASEIERLESLFRAESLPGLVYKIDPRSYVHHDTGWESECSVKSKESVNRATEKKAVSSDWSTWNADLSLPAWAVGIDVGFVGVGEGGNASRSTVSRERERERGGEEKERETDK